MPDKGITYIDEVDIQNKRVLLRADFDVSLNPNYTIADDARIKQNLPTIEFLLKKHNRLICIAKLDRPKNRDPKYSMKVVVQRLKQLLPHNKIRLVDEFLTANNKIFAEQETGEILVLENMRYYEENKKNDQTFAKKLASLADIYVNDGFAMSHRTEAWVVSVPKYIPSFGGLLLKKEIKMISKTVKKPKKPFVAIIGGAKIETKINLISKLTEMADYVLIGGGLANTFLCAHGYEIGKSYCEYDKVTMARHLLFLAAQKKTAIVLPSDVIIGDPDDDKNGGRVVKVNQIPKGAVALDIGPETKAKFGAVISKAKTIVWNGPIGYFENPAYRQGTDFVYYSIAGNRDAISIVGGGDTLAAISKKEYLNTITHVSTGGGAMLEFIEKGKLPGIEALKR
ncbi:phosphoglycerate kinase [Candidatus Roizmanbacteria bacterium RIFCSPHIGHO2_01_FULL_39_8]|uniref:Phosphoglycerate kinase n=3 Tax=Candidatus Roizmaniibacteriota TaxID=1752723 RepID=A0A1F7GFJ1_9BACT|nr:MAG: phosphoglycerate kinase [Candidatus Roizmanbacteria bacterium RIFCSPHIGHO2_01_FULL_39_8]OGK25630.1 MAG: phosphoglycerate kinase [Candidatus Roizmanbacteria bacterium RIFCSPHIGHO2_02_FULL_39_9]OGK37336.1 MAG: phosphoglycerate kinase [Candidatus Roizmanbacteria bacterium RIFCSPHIGHO2_12_FULL_39_8]